MHNCSLIAFSPTCSHKPNKLPHRLCSLAYIDKGVSRIIIQLFATDQQAACTGSLTSAQAQGCGATKDRRRTFTPVQRETGNRQYTAVQLLRNSHTTLLLLLCSTPYFEASYGTGFLCGPSGVQSALTLRLLCKRKVGVTETVRRQAGVGLHRI